MYTILLCDDEFFVREMLKQAIDWEGAGLTIVGEAETGEEAVALAKELGPDAMLLDINMPLKSGLDALAEIRRWNPDMEIVIVTGHDLFEYAQRGIKHRIFDYLVKPVDDRDLLDTCGRLVRSLAERERSRNTGIYFPALPRPEELGTALEELGADHVGCIALAIDGEGEPSGWQLLESERRVGGWLREWLGAPCVFFLDRENLVCVFAASTPLPEEKVAELPALFQRHFGRVASVGYCGAAGMPEHLHAVYERTKSALAQRFFDERRHIFTDPAGNGCRVLNGELRDLPLERIVTELRLGNAEACTRLIGQLFDTLAEYAAAMGPDLVKTICGDTIGSILTVYYGLNEYSANMLLKTEIDAEIRRFSSLDALREWMCDILRSLCGPGSKGKAKPPYVQLARAAVRENLTSPELSVALISSRLYINTSYLSHFFKKECGIGLNDYITEERMKLAQEILRNECPKIEEMALRVGYKNADYFGKSFKKKFGVPYSKMKLSYHQS